MRPSHFFPSWFIAGFECSTHRRADGRRLDLLEATGHARLAHTDYQRAAAVGLNTVRDGARWHLIESEPGAYRWDSWVGMINAAKLSGVRVIWDLCHYGWPDHVDVWSDEFPARFAAFARACTEKLIQLDEASPFFCPVNEMSYLAWAGGETGQINPGAFGRGVELKDQLVKAFAAACLAIREVAPHSLIMTSEPLIYVCAGSAPERLAEAECYHRAQFEAVDTLLDRTDKSLFGACATPDILGVNFYPDNQWYFQGSTIPFGHHAYRPLSELLVEVFNRYRKPLLISETGAEGSARPHWLSYVCSEVHRARAAGVPVHGLCLYPILDYAGWQNDRVCRVGMWSGPDRNGERRVDSELLFALRQQMLSRPPTEVEGWRAMNEWDRHLAV